MPAVKSGKVLVTGANGYIAAWTVNTLLEQGYSVRGTVRSEAKAVALRQTFSKYGDRLEAIVIDDIAKVCRAAYTLRRIQEMKAALTILSRSPERCSR